MPSRADEQDTPLLDFIFAVSHPSHWHAINMQQNPHHYSLPMRMLGSDSVAWMQENGLGAGVWFNIGVEVNGKVRLSTSCDADKGRNSSMGSSQSTRSVAICSTGKRSTSQVGLTSPFVPQISLRESDLTLPGPNPRRRRPCATREPGQSRLRVPNLAAPSPGGVHRAAAVRDDRRSFVSWRLPHEGGREPIQGAKHRRNSTGRLPKIVWRFDQEFLEERLCRRG